MEYIALISFGVLSRIIPHPANVTAIGGASFFAGNKRNVWLAMSISFIAMGVSDMVIGFHAIMWATYMGMFGYVLAGRVLQSTQSMRPRLFGVTIASTWFFLITNYAVWTQGLIYPKTFTGLINCFVMALPFFRNSLIGDIAVTASLFSLSHAVQKYFRNTNARAYHVDLKKYYLSSFIYYVSFYSKFHY
ncbi:MAG TPA: DUF6580 family putative transport protein [Patescibacteria group bacterium]|nr:DUF6580 family putative transport protein [Patescibacteria group bacterium]